MTTITCIVFPKAVTVADATFVSIDLPDAVVVSSSF